VAHGREAVDYAERAGNQAGRIYAYFTLGLDDALESRGGGCEGARVMKCAACRMRKWEMRRAHLCAYER
jgi:hypothetical protein